MAMTKETRRMRKETTTNTKVAITRTTCRRTQILTRTKEGTRSQILAMMK